MEETLTDCLMRMREDLTKLKKTPEENTKKRPTEPLNSILSACLSQNTPETGALETLLDTFHDLVNNNNEPDVWSNFDCEIAIICSKILSGIERSEMFEVLFSKFLWVLREISANRWEVWESIARQILNVLINKKISAGCFETILKGYANILKNVDSVALDNFSLQNLHLLKTLSLLLHRVGDFETQHAIMLVVFMHLSNDRKLPSEFFAVCDEDKALLQSLTFANFDDDCRVYLNSINKPRRGFERKVYSICCLVLYLGGCFVQPLTGRKVIWIDANKDSQRLSFKCANFDTDDQTTIYVPFEDIVDVVGIETEKTEGNFCVRIQTKNLRCLHDDVKNDDISLVADSRKDVTDFVCFLQSMIRKTTEKFSKTDTLFIDRSIISNEGLQVNAISSSARPEVDAIVPDLIHLFGTEIKISSDLRIVLETQPSPSLIDTLEDTANKNQQSKFLQSKTYKLMTSQEKFSLEPEEVPFCFEFKENTPPKQKTYKKKPQQPLNPPYERILRERKQETSQDCFQQEGRKKPTLPKFNRQKKTQKRKRKCKPKQKDSENVKPSLLDPNGYAFQRWLQPTTSERSNFWLRKLQEENKAKGDVFHFSDSGSEVRKPKRVIHSKRRYRRQKYETKRPQLKQVTDILRNMKKSSPEVKKPSPVRRVATPEPETPLRDTPSPQWTETCVTHAEILSGELTKPQKRNRSDEENSQIRLKKRTKERKIPETLLPTISRRIQKAEDKARQQTNEIITTMNKVTNHILNNLQRKETTKMTSYLNMAEEASKELQADVEQVHRFGKRLHRVMVYFKNGCSVSELCDSVEGCSAKIRNSVKIANKEGQNNIHTVMEKLRSLIESEIDKFIKNELASKRNQLMRCASMLQTEFG